MGGVMVEVVTG